MGMSMQVMRTASRQAVDFFMIPLGLQCGYKVLYFAPFVKQFKKMALYYKPEIMKASLDF